MHGKRACSTQFSHRSLKAKSADLDFVSIKSELFAYSMFVVDFPVTVTVTVTSMACLQQKH